jgi:hypothetical protein
MARVGIMGLRDRIDELGAKVDKGFLDANRNTEREL